jgi:hypothetical protein
MRALALALVLLSAASAAGQVRTVKPNQYQKKRTGTAVVFSFSPSGNCTGAAVTGSPGVTISLTRATSATCVKNDGSLATVTSGQPRVNSWGLQVEPAATNLALRSDALDNASWSKFSTTVDATNTATFLDGVASMETITSSAISGSVIQSTTVTSSVGPFTSSAFSAATSGTHAASVAVSCGASTPSVCTCTRADGGACTARTSGVYCVNDSTVGTTPVRVTATVTCNAAITTSGIFIAGGTYQSATGTHNWGGLQFETGAAATGYIVTAGTTATRNAELYSFTPPAQWPVATGDVTVVFRPGSSTLGIGRFIHARGATDGFSLYYSGLTVRLDTGNATTLSTLNTNVGSWVAGQSYTLRATWGAGNTALYRDGALLGSVVNGSSNMPTTAIASAGLGNGVSQIVSGYISSITVTR